MSEAVNIIKKQHRSLQESRSTPVFAAADEEALAAKSAAILSMVGEDPMDDPESRADAPFAEPVAAHTRTEQLLAQILEQLRRMQKNEMFGEFSLLRLLAGIVQVFVPFCLLLALWFLMGPNRQDQNVFVALGFAVALQLMALTFYIMNGLR